MSPLSWDDAIVMSISVWVEALFFGLYTVLMGVCAYFSVHVNHENQGINTRLLIVSTTMYVICATNAAVDISATIAWMRLSASPSRVALLPLYFNFEIASHGLFIANQAIGDALLIYRCFVLWSSNIRIVLVPILMVILNTVLGYLYIYGEAKEDLDGNSQSTMVQRLNTTVRTAWLVTSLATNVLLTALIASRIWLSSRSVRASHGMTKRHARIYRRVILMTIESGALYSAALLAYTITWLVYDFSPNNLLRLYYYVPSAAASQLVGIAPTLIIVRVSLGKRISANAFADETTCADAARWSDCIDYALDRQGEDSVAEEG